MRAQPAWEGDQLWTVPVSAGEFPVGAGARITGVDLRGYQQMRLVLAVGTGGLADAVLFWRYSLDGGTTWADTSASITLDGVNDQTFWGSWEDIPVALRQSIDVVLALFGSIGDGSTQVQVLDFAVNIRGLDQTSAARLLPMQVPPAEKLALRRDGAAQLQPAGHRRHCALQRRQCRPSGPAPPTPWRSPTTTAWSRSPMPRRSP